MGLFELLLLASLAVSGVGVANQDNVNIDKQVREFDGENLKTLTKAEK